MACNTKTIMEEFHQLRLNSTDVSGLRLWCICLRFHESYALPSRCRYIRDHMDGKKHLCLTLE